jgi:hypothetical protein
MGTVINIGVLLSFACTLACINSTARLFFDGPSRALPRRFGKLTRRTNTAYCHWLVGAGHLPGLGALFVRVGVFPAQGFFGALSSFGFLFAHILSPSPRRSICATWQTRRVDLLPAALVSFMILPVVGAIGIPGSTVFPQQKFPQSLPWIFLVYMLIGFMWLLIQRFRSPSLMGMKGAVDKIELQFSEVRKALIHRTSGQTRSLTLTLSG